MPDAPTNVTTTASPNTGGAIVGPGFAPAGLTGPGLDDSKLVGCRRVDLGREDELVTWAEWFQRSAQALDNFLAAQFGNQAQPSGDTGGGAAGVPAGAPSGAPALAKVFRVTLTDGRPFAVTAVQTHINRGLCFPGNTDRWTDDDRPTCDVITGYTMIGSGPDGRPTALSVPPNQIASVECVLVPQAMHARALEKHKDEQEEQAFGFARFAQMRDRPELEEVEDQTNPAADPAAGNT